jgi:hypothetical protein
MLPAFKMPEPLFAVINPVMKLLLRSPLHGLLSSGIMLITFQGKKSRRWFTTPVRYIKDDKTVRAFSSADTFWWRNLLGGADVTLRLKGKDAGYHAVAVRDNSELIRRWMEVYLERYPEDRVYHDIGLNKDGSFNEADFARAVTEAVLVEANPI